MKNGIAMKKDDLKNLRLDVSLKMSMKVTDYIDDFDDFIDDLEDFYQKKFWEIPEENVIDALVGCLHENFDSDLIDDLCNESDLEIDVWKPELF